MNYEKTYERIQWVNESDGKTTALGATNMNKMDRAIDILDDRVIELNIIKAEQSDLLLSVKSITYDKTTGVFTFTWHNGSSFEVDLNVEKIPASFSMGEDGVITMVNTDGTTYTADMRAIIPVITFENSDTVSVTKEYGKKEIATNVSSFVYEFDELYTGNLYLYSDSPVNYTMIVRTENASTNMSSAVAGESTVKLDNTKRISLTAQYEGIITSAKIDDFTGQNAVYKFDVIKGSITEEHLHPQYLADIKAQATSASTSATNASASATSASESATSAKEDAERAELAAKNAEAVSGVGIATETVAGLMSGGDNAVSEDGTLMLTKVTTDRTLEKSKAGGLKINRVDGESQQKQYSGNQLYNRSSAVAGADFFGSDGLPTTDNTVSVTQIDVSPSTNYTVSDMVGGQYARFNYLAEDGSFISRTLVTVSQGTVTLTTPENCYKMQIAVDSSMSQLMLAEGSVALPWEPFVGNQPSPSPSFPQSIESVEVSEIKSVGKNFYDNISNFVAINYSGITVSKGVDDTFNVIGKATGFINIIQKTFSLPAGKYIVSRKQRENRLVGLALYNKTKSTFITQSIPYEGFLFEIDEDSTFDIRIQVASGSEVNVIGQAIMIRLASVEDDTYEPYHESIIQLSNPITLRGIGDVKDGIVKQNGVYGILRNIGSTVLNGSEFWMPLSASSSGRLYTNAIQSKIKRPTNNSTLATWVKCSHYRVSVRNNPSNNTLAVEYVGNIVFYDNTNAIDTDTWKAWLSANNVTVDYQLANPVFEPLPVSDQIALHQLKTFDTVTHISTDSTIEPVIEMEYGTSVVGGYAIKGMNTAEANRLENEQLKATMLILSNALLESESEV